MYFFISYYIFTIRETSQLATLLDGSFVNVINLFILRHKIIQSLFLARHWKDRCDLYPYIQAQTH